MRTLAGPNDLKAPSSVMAHWWYIPLFISVCRPVYCVTVAASSFLLKLAPKIYYCSCLLHYNRHPQKFIIFHVLVCTRLLGEKMQTHYRLAFQHKDNRCTKHFQIPLQLPLLPPLSALSMVTQQMDALSYCFQRPQTIVTAENMSCVWLKRAVKCILTQNDIMMQNNIKKM